MNFVLLLDFIYTPSFLKSSNEFKQKDIKKSFSLRKLIDC